MDRGALPQVDKADLQPCRWLRFELQINKSSTHCCRTAHPCRRPSHPYSPVALHRRPSPLRINRFRQNGQPRRTRTCASHDLAPKESPHRR
jgi:hypothetical protein